MNIKNYNLMQEPKVTISYISTDMPYDEAQKLQEDKVAEIIDHKTSEHLFFVEHSPIFTCGSSAQDTDLLNIGDIPAVKTGRGGKITYHGPGQRVLYPILDLRERGRDLRKYICMLQTWIINTLDHYGIEAHGDDDVGVWVTTPDGEKKIAAIGVRVRKWVTFHGIALNVHPDMEHFTRIVPCGIEGKGVTSMRELGFMGDLASVDSILKHEFELLFRSELMR